MFESLILLRYLKKKKKGRFVCNHKRGGNINCLSKMRNSIPDITPTFPHF